MPSIGESLSCKKQATPITVVGCSKYHIKGIIYGVLPVICIAVAFITGVAVGAHNRPIHATSSTYAVITHSNPDIGSTFWEQSRIGFEDYAEHDGVRLHFVETKYDEKVHVDAINTYCNHADAMAITVPFPSSSEEYMLIDDAISDCIRQNSTRVVIFNTDTYRNEDAVGFVGPDNYVIGENCGLGILTDFDASISGHRQPLVESSVIMYASPVNLTIYVSPKETDNSGILTRAQSMRRVINEWTQKTNMTAHITHSLEGHAIGSKVVAMGIGATLEADDTLGAGAAFLNCGDVLKSNGTLIGIGQVPYAQAQETYHTMKASGLENWNRYVPKGNFFFLAMILAWAITIPGQSIIAGALGLVVSTVGSAAVGAALGGK